MLRIYFKKVCSNWESDPEHKLGKLGLYHLTITALVNYINNLFLKSYHEKQVDNVNGFAGVYCRLRRR